MAPTLMERMPMAPSIPIASATIPIICGVIMPPKAAIANSKDIPEVEPLIHSPALAIPVG